MKLPQIFSSALMCIALMASQGSLAAFDGTMGPTSTGEITITLRISQGIQIENLDDIVIVTTNHEKEDLVLSKQFCIRGNLNDLYTLTAFSNTPAADSYYLIGPNTSRLGFELFFKGDLSVNVGDELQPQTFSKKYTVDQSGQNCNGQDNAEITIVIPYTELNNAQYDQYNGFLNMTVAVD